MQTMASIPESQASQINVTNYFTVSEGGNKSSDQCGVDGNANQWQRGGAVERAVVAVLKRPSSLPGEVLVEGYTAYLFKPPAPPPLQPPPPPPPGPAPPPPNSATLTADCLCVYDFGMVNAHSKTRPGGTLPAIGSVVTLSAGVCGFQVCPRTIVGTVRFKVAGTTDNSSLVYKFKIYGPKQ